jgi:hypothetical protein
MSETRAHVKVESKRTCVGGADWSIQPSQSPTTVFTSVPLACQLCDHDRNTSYASAEARGAPMRTNRDCGKTWETHRTCCVPAACPGMPHVPSVQESACARWKGRRALVVVTIAPSANGMRVRDQLHVRAHTIMVTNGRKCECVDSDT